MIMHVLKYPTWGQASPAHHHFCKLFWSQMDLCVSFILVSLLTISQSQPASHTIILNDIEAAITDNRSQNFFGFALLLQMLKISAQVLGLNFSHSNWSRIDQTTFKNSCSATHSQCHSHSLTWVIFQQGHWFHQGLTISYSIQGKADFSVNNAQVIKPNLCLNSIIKCHGIDL
jgi:hypothetical protein